MTDLRGNKGGRGRKNEGSRFQAQSELSTSETAEGLLTKSFCFQAFGESWCDEQGAELDKTSVLPSFPLIPLSSPFFSFLPFLPSLLLTPSFLLHLPFLTLFPSSLLSLPSLLLSSLLPPLLTCQVRWLTIRTVRGFFGQHRIATTWPPGHWIVFDSFSDFWDGAANDWREKVNLEREGEDSSGWSNVSLLCSRSSNNLGHSPKKNEGCLSKPRTTL